MVAFSTIKPGDVLYDLKKRNSAMVYEVRVIASIPGSAIVSYSGNPPRNAGRRVITRLRRPPDKDAPP
ncbi:hypothetical protein [Azospirillum sp. TSH58]|uniref:hypothetical protein n=1 Tax=Azospirillum sp. TSH58 TaxID=664962 RepID=UPI0013A547BE|nr:hypothetical protein [Azospirillum sp. TSH58]